MKLFRILAAIAAFATVALLFAAPASAQATRTWVSGVGDDANPCSRTAPCKTFAGAISKTATAGEINCLDPGGFGALTITKAITISCQAGTAGVLVSGTNGITVAAGATDVVYLSGLDFEGLNSSLSGVQVNTAGEVTIVNCIVRGFNTAGVNVAPSAGGVHVAVIDSIIADNPGTGILIGPTGTGSVRASVSGTKVTGNAGDGVMSNATATSGSIKTSITATESAHNAGVGFAVFSAGADDETMVDNSAASDNNFGIAANGAGAIIRFGRTNLTSNSTGAGQLSGGSAISYQNNNIDGNGAGGNGNFVTAALH
jgi:hypothetical protein